MYTEPGISSSRSRSSDLTLNMEGPSSLMHTVKLGENGRAALPKKLSSVAFG